MSWRFACAQPARVLQAVRTASVLLVAVWLTGCASVPGALSPVVSDDGFALEGRLAVNYGGQNTSGKVQWIHEKVRDEIALASPLGTQVALLVRNAVGVTLTDSEQNRHSAPDAESLTEQRLGWRLPLTGLADWVRGSPLGGTTHEARRDARGRIAWLAQSDWQIEYTYDDSATTAAYLPRRLFMRYLKAAEPLEIRIVIDRWAVQ